MQERDYPKFVAFPHRADDPDFMHPSERILPASAWTERVAQLSQEEAAEIAQAIEVAADLQSDVHLYRKVGSHFLGIEYLLGMGPTVKVFEHPDVHA